MRLSILAACIGLLFLLASDCQASKACKGGQCAVENDAKAPAVAKTVEKAAVTEPAKKEKKHRRLNLFKRHYRKGCKSC